MSRRPCTDSERMPPHAAAPRPLVLYDLPGGHFARRHERLTRERLAQILSGLCGLRFVGDYQAREHLSLRPYFLPNDTLDAAAAAELGIRSAEDLFGGCVSHAFVATKAITQPLLHPDAAAPPGWSHAFSQRTHAVVLRGFTAFSREDARAAGERLLGDGPVRLKPAGGAGGLGQRVATSGVELREGLQAIDDEDIAAHGVVLEENLEHVVTYSIGSVHVAGVDASYHGVQRETTDAHGRSVYGGSELWIQRGTLADLAASSLPEPVRLPVRQALIYDEAARASFPGMILSRRNYDVACGVDARGRTRCGVLEQSWRIGGATPAELVGVAALCADPALLRLQASCYELYGSREAPPDGCALLLGVDDPDVGAISRYTRVEPLEHA